MVQKIGTALLASAGLIGLVAGIAAKPVFGNLIAGLQIAVTQPIRLDDVVIVEGEWGRIEEIGSSYVVCRPAWHGLPVAGLPGADRSDPHRAGADLPR
ncbi:hypothetical protein G6F55_014292 [Rhizopus delemar]|nr:hypothetical protein G6F55_014292 [Rhizopus delemar]